MRFNKFIVSGLVIFCMNLSEHSCKIVFEVTFEWHTVHTLLVKLILCVGGIGRGRLCKTTTK